MRSVIEEAGHRVQRACVHQLEFVVLRTANGAEQVRRGCVQCGWREQRSYPHGEHPEMARYPLVVQTARIHRVDYEAYLQTEDWLERRHAAIMRAGQRCQLCGTEAEPFHVHHNTYRRLGAELETDLTVLCEDCHGAFHDRAKLAEQRHREAA